MAHPSVKNKTRITFNSIDDATGRPVLRTAVIDRQHTKEASVRAAEAVLGMFYIDPDSVVELTHFSHADSAVTGLPLNRLDGTVRLFGQNADTAKPHRPQTIAAVHRLKGGKST